ncbi:nuclear transport factor 2 family protein [Pseudomonas sp. SZMC_28357]|uniref:nuclear transport factor 2 family protein n=1 Tax=Pseudomonas sp. SZMC_28357 TaxID=3074380 RepID=UPI002872A9F1|nr:nuclear transport factor 2 family protein [Pseudomonas sp. SZMC_28357]MDR9752509.1 nuclear transport factor 2 family protein [Pseudomonas sp. SZMC_28357]
MSYAMKAMFDCIDRKNIEGFLSYLADDVEFRFGNAPKLVGKAAIEQGVSAFYSQIETLEHVMTGVWVHDDVTLLEFDSYYTRHDGLTVGVPCCVVLRFNVDRLIRDYRINIDLSPVFTSAPDSYLIRASV